MTLIRSLTILLTTLTLAGCVQSIQPFVKDSQYTYDPSLVGKWADDDGNVIVVTGDQASNSYAAAASEKDGKSGNYILHLAKLQNHLLIDVAPAELAMNDTTDTYKAQFLPLHTFFLLEKTASGIQLTTLDPDWCKKLLEAHPDVIAHADADKDRVLLTASTDQLQDFILKHVDTDGALSKPTDFKRVESTPSTK